MSLALAIHELATNAIKYGALSNDQGQIRIIWDDKPDCGTPTFHFLWQETAGPAVVKPSSIGFGSQLIMRVLGADFGPDVEMLYEPGGLTFRLSAPMANIRAPVPLVDLQ